MASMNPQEFFSSVQEVRKILEPEIAALAALNRTPQQLRAITEAFEDMRQAKPGLNSVAPDVRFHLALLAAANNVLLTPFGIMIEAALTNMFEFTSIHNPEPDMFIPKHEGILKAVTRGNAKAARKAALSLLTDTDHTIAHLPAKAKKPKKA
jgi:DNA-binding FadR family transcriptional regulator